MAPAAFASRCRLRTQMEAMMATVMVEAPTGCLGELAPLRAQVATFCQRAQEERYRAVLAMTPGKALAPRVRAELLRPLVAPSGWAPRRIRPGLLWAHPGEQAPKEEERARAAAAARRARAA